MADVVATRPARGTRPSNRRELIVTAAADLFYRNGYANVSMSDIAEAVVIGPSALYRHFRNKETLLATVVERGVAEINAGLNEALADPAGDVGQVLAVACMHNRSTGVLWRREGRYLSAEIRSELRLQSRAVGEQIAALVRRRRPALNDHAADLLAWCSLAIAQSVSYHRLQLPVPEFTALVATMIDRAIEAPLPNMEVHPPGVERQPSLQGATRRETILTEATRLFGEQGFSNVSVENIGTAIGATGPSIYNHFTGKSDILLAAMHRGGEWLQLDLARSLAQATGARDALLRLLDNYASFVFENPHLMSLLGSELLEVSDSERERSRATQLAYIGEWVRLLQELHPEWDTIHARIRIQAVHTMVSHIASTPHLRALTSVDTAMTAIGAALLELG